MVPAAAAYNWAGLYVGGHLGYGRATARITDIDCYCIVAGAGAFAGFKFPFSYNGWVGGAQLGHNWQAGRWVYGVELDISFSGMRTSFASPLFPAAAQESFSSKITWFGTGRARLGYAFDRVLPYVTGGVAFANIENRYNDPLDGNFSVASGVKWGWTAGGGVEVALNPAWSIRGEYLHVQLRTAAGNFPAGVGCGNRGCRFDWDNHFHVYRVGLNYRFGGPIAARY